MLADCWNNQNLACSGENGNNAGIMGEKQRGKPLIGFIGQGFIGKNYADDFERRGYRVVRYSLEEPYVKNKARIPECDIVFIAVPTPTSENGFDASIVRAAVSLVGKGKTAIIKSTIVPGTTRKIQQEFSDRIVIYSPEFLSEVTAAHDAAYPFSNIVGLTMNTPEQKAVAKIIHSVLPKALFRLTCTSTEAEIIKYSHNGSGYTQIMFFNLMYDLASHHGCDWKPIQRALEEDPMISNRDAHPIHKSGRGAGGHCFIKDIAAIREQYGGTVKDEAGSRLLEAMEKKNIQLLRSTGKDLDLLSGVYGDTVLEHPVEKFALPRLSSVHGVTNVLVCTETIDKTDPLLGFFHSWVEEFARHAEHVHVISLSHGERTLPPNVSEHSLGKGSTRGSRFIKRILYTARLMRHAWRERNEYDTVFVHLSPEYIAAAGLLWRLMGKRVGFWYNDAHSSWLTRAAISLSNVLFYSSPNSYAARFPNARHIPTGIDAQMYLNQPRNAKPGSLLFLGRITPKKNLGETLAAVSRLAGKGEKIKLDIYGTTRPEDEKYANQLRSKFSELERSKALSYRGSVLSDQTPAVYASHEIFIHSGSMRGFNKTLYEAMAAGCLVVTSDSEVKEVVDKRLFAADGSAGAIAKAISRALRLTETEAAEERAKLRAFVRREHALSSVAPIMLEMVARKGGKYGA